MFLLFFFLGFVVAAQIRGRILDREEQAGRRHRLCHRSRRLRRLGLQGDDPRLRQATDLDHRGRFRHGDDARAGEHRRGGSAPGTFSYGEATGITQTIRNYGASLGLAALGTILLFTYRSHLTASLKAMGDPNAAAERQPITQTQQGHRSVTSIPRFTSLDAAHATQAVLYVMCGIMAFAGVVALFGLQRGRQEVAPVEDGTVASPAGGV